MQRVTDSILAFINCSGLSCLYNFFWSPQPLAPCCCVGVIWTSFAVHPMQDPGVIVSTVDEPCRAVPLAGLFIKFQLRECAELDRRVFGMPETCYSLMGRKQPGHRKEACPGIRTQRTGRRRRATLWLELGSRQLHPVPLGPAQLAALS
jgi:hypothetical protein